MYPMFLRVLRDERFERFERFSFLHTNNIKLYAINKNDFRDIFINVSVHSPPNPTGKILPLICGKENSAVPLHRHDTTCLTKN